MAAPKKDEAPVEQAEESVDLFAEAQKAAPNLTREFVKKYGLDDDWLAKIARGELSPPPTVGPEHSVDLHYVNGGWQVTPVGVKPEDVGKDAVGRN
jgi:hypothetical protein